MKILSSVENLTRHKLIDNPYIKYSNFILGVLMSCIAALELESIFHDIRISRTIFDNMIENANILLRESLSYAKNKSEAAQTYSIFNSIQVEQDLQSADSMKQSFIPLFTIAKNNSHFFDVCHLCNNDSRRTLATFNVYGLMLACLLAVFSFMFMNKCRIFEKHIRIFIPTFTVTILLIIAYFICTVTINLPQSCNNMPRICDLDFYFHFSVSKIPRSALMLLCIPQIILRLYLSIVTKLSHDSRKIIEHEDEETLNDTEYRIEEQRAVTRAHNASIKMDLLSKSDLTQHLTLVDEFREVPIDCPLITHQPKHQIQSSSPIRKQSPDSIFNHELASNFYFPFDAYRTDFIIDTDLSNPILEEPLQMLTVSSSNTQQRYPTPNKRIFNKMTSLSTIMEERTPQSSNMNATSDVQRNENAGWSIVRAMFEEIHNKQLIMKEILHVFEPSSESGNFRRNIPIRVSPEMKSKNKAVTSTSSIVPTISPNSSNNASSVYSKFSPISYKKASFQPTIDNFYLLNLNQYINTMGKSYESRLYDWKSLDLDIKKARLVKRLQDSIENKKGISFSGNLKKSRSSHDVVKCLSFTENSVSKFECEPNRLQSSNKNSNYTRSCNDVRKRANFEDEIENEMPEAVVAFEKINDVINNSICSNHEQSKLLIKSDVDPVFF